MLPINLSATKTFCKELKLHPSKKSVSGTQYKNPILSSGTWRQLSCDATFVYFSRPRGGPKAETSENTHEVTQNNLRGDKIPLVLQSFGNGPKQVIHIFPNSIPTLPHSSKNKQTNKLYTNLLKGVLMARHNLYTAFLWSIGSNVPDSHCNNNKNMWLNYLQYI